jgi:hypothetical protein
LKRLKKIVCPGEHKEKILAIYREEDGNVPVHKFWIHCGNMNCSNPWVQIEFNIKRGVKVTPMPKTVRFDVEKIPLLVVS